MYRILNLIHTENIILHIDKCWFPRTIFLAWMRTHRVMSNLVAVFHSVMCNLVAVLHSMMCNLVGMFHQWENWSNPHIEGNLSICSPRSSYWLKYVFYSCWRYNLIHWELSSSARNRWLDDYYKGWVRLIASKMSYTRFIKKSEFGLFSLCH